MVYQVYDIELNNANVISVLKYRVEDVSTYVEGKSKTERHFLFKGADYPENLEEAVEILQNNGYIDMQSFASDNIDEMFLNTVVRLKLMLMGRNYKLLEKYYQEEIVDNMCILDKYITYVHMQTGKIATMKVASLGLYTPKKKVELDKAGYKPVQASFYYQHLQQNPKKVRRK